MNVIESFQRKLNDWLNTIIVRREYMDVQKNIDFSRPNTIKRFVSRYNTRTIERIIRVTNEIPTEEYIDYLHLVAFFTSYRNRQHGILSFQKNHNRKCIIQNRSNSDNPNTIYKYYHFIHPP